MSITTAQRLERRNYLGSSDMAAVLGLTKKPNAYDIWASKVYDLDEADKDNENIEIGNDFEAPLVKWAERKLGSRIETDPDKLEFRHPTDSLFVDHIDGVLLDRPGEGIEAKSTSAFVSDYGEPGTDEIPERVIVQCQHHMACTGFHRIHVPVLTGKFGLKRELYVVERNDKLIEIILAKGRDFWLNHVVPRIPPDVSTPPSIELLRRIKREPGTWAEVDEAVIDAYLTARDAYLAADKANDAAKATLIAKLGDAEGARHPYGIVTYFSQKGKDKIDLDLLRSKYPDVYREISKPATNRVLRFKKNA